MTISISAILQAALADQQAGRLNEAAARHRFVLALFPDHPDAIYYYGYLFHQGGLPLMARRWTNRAIHLCPGQIHFLQNRAAIEFDHRELGAALFYLKRAAALDPTATGIIDGLSRAWAGSDVTALRWAVRAVLLGASGESTMRLLLNNPDLVAPSRALAVPFEELPLSCARLLDILDRRDHASSDAKFLALFLSWIDDADVPKAIKPSILPAIKFGPDTPRDTNALLFENCFLPALARLLAIGDYTTARRFEHYNRITFGFQPHTYAQAKYCYDRIAPLFREAARRLPRQARPVYHRRTPIRLAFVTDLPITDIKPDDEIIMDLASILSRYESDGIAPRLVGFGGVTAEAEILAQQLRLDLLNLDRVRGLGIDHDDLLSRAETLKQILSQWNCQILIWYHATEGTAEFLALQSLAPIQVYYAMGTRQVGSDVWDGYLADLAAAPTTITTNARRWHGFLRPVRNYYPPPDSAAWNAQVDEAAAIRAQRFPDHRILLASIGRAEKLGESYIRTVAKILRATPPDVVFLWFGGHENREVTRLMLEYGISDRCLFQGWVDVGLYARIIDIHLESFPFGSGVTMAYTMQAQRAFVWPDIGSADDSYAPWRFFYPLVDGSQGTEAEIAKARSIFVERDGHTQLDVLARSEDEYVRIAVDLINDPERRRHVGRVGRAIVENFWFNHRRIAAGFRQQIEDIVSTALQP